MASAPKKTNNNRQVLKKHVSAIHAVADLTALQRKLVNALLLNAYDSLIVQQDHKISTNLLCEMIGFDSKNLGYLKKALVGIMETVMEFDIMEDDGEQSWEAMSLLTYVKVKGGVCTYRYDRGLAEKLHHPEIYSKINLSILRNMRSSYALVLYENCLRYIGVGQTPVWDLALFRKLMAVEGRYNEFKFLKRDVIVPAMKEVNELSNIQIDLLTVRKGRSVAAVQFTVKSNPQLALLGMEEDDEISSCEAYKQLRAYKIASACARAWVIEYGENYVLEKIGLLKTQVSAGKIKSSKAGFLKSAIEQDYHSEEAEKQKVIGAAKAAKVEREKIEAQIEDVKKSLRDIEISYRWYIADIIEKSYQSLSEADQAAVKQEFIATLPSAIYARAFEKGGWKDRLTFPGSKNFWMARGLDLPSIEAWCQSKGYEDPATLNEKVADLKASQEKIAI